MICFDVPSEIGGPFCLIIALITRFGFTLKMNDFHMPAEVPRLIGGVVAYSTKVQSFGGNTEMPGYVRFFRHFGDNISCSSKS